MKIINDAGLPYKIIGQVIDDVINRGEDETIYTGKVEAFTIDYKDNLYKVQIRYLKSFVEWRFMYYE